MKKYIVGDRIFNFRLFVEGLKHLRVITMAVGILALVASALVPIVDLMNHHPRTNPNTGEYIITKYNYWSICLPAVLTVLLAPFFFAALFSFLHKRKESDFFHAIPYTRTCVYISFSAAALASVFAIQILSALVAGVLTAMIPYTVFDVGRYVCLMLATLLGSAMLSAFMMLALCVSGTGGTCGVLYILFAALPRIIAALLVLAIEQVPVLNTDYWIAESPLSPLWFYPLGVVGTVFSIDPIVQGFPFKPAVVIYSLIVTLLLFVLAGFLYNRRQSEMAENHAPGTKTQALFRILFTLPMALIMTAMICYGHLRASLVLVGIVLTLLCYFLYELLTTKRPKNMLKTAPGLLIVLCVCIAYGMVHIGVESYIQHEKPIRSEDVASVTLPELLATGGVYGDYDSTLTLENAYPIQIITNAYNETKMGVSGGRRAEITITLKNGRKLHRFIWLSEAAQEALRRGALFKSTA